MERVGLRVNRWGYSQWKEGEGWMKGDARDTSASRRSTVRMPLTLQGGHLEVGQSVSKYHKIMFFSDEPDITKVTY